MQLKRIICHLIITYIIYFLKLFKFLEHFNVHKENCTISCKCGAVSGRYTPTVSYEISLILNNLNIFKF